MVLNFNRLVVKMLVNFVFKISEMWHNWTIHHNLGSIEEFELWKIKIATSSKHILHFKRLEEMGAMGI